MNNRKQNLTVRWLYLAVGVVAMLFAGVLYAWSILKAPLAAEFGWGASSLALNFTLAMSLFCIGGLLGARISKGAGHRVALIIAGILSAAGFSLTAMSILLKVEWTLLLIGIIFVIETASVMIQVTYFKKTGKRIFKMSPIHHHFEMIDWSEWKIVSVFGTIGLIATLITLFLL